MAQRERNSEEFSDRASGSYTGIGSPYDYLR